MQPCAARELTSATATPCREVVDLFQKLFLTSIIPFIAPRSSVQIIVAALFALCMLLVTLQTAPYRAASSNQLSALSQVNIFLFLFTGLLLNTDPDGIASNRILFAVLVGALTTSIVVMSLVLFVRSLIRQTVRALYAVETDSEDEGDDDVPDMESPPMKPLEGVAEMDESLLLRPSFDGEPPKMPPPPPLAPLNPDARIVRVSSGGRLSAAATPPPSSPVVRGYERPLSRATSPSRAQGLMSLLADGAQPPVPPK